jgi:hypothetical protein
MATVAQDCFGTWSVFSDDGDTLGRYAVKKDADNRLRDLQEDNEIRSAAATLGRKGGSSKSLAKQVASRTNGKLGGRREK